MPVLPLHLFPTLLPQLIAPPRLLLPLLIPLLPPLLPLLLLPLLLPLLLLMSPRLPPLLPWAPHQVEGCECRPLCTPPHSTAASWHPAVQPPALHCRIVASCCSLSLPQLIGHCWRHQHHSLAKRVGCQPRLHTAGKRHVSTAVSFPLLHNALPLAQMVLQSRRGCASLCKPLELPCCSCSDCKPFESLCQCILSQYCFPSSPAGSHSGLRHKL